MTSRNVTISRKKAVRLSIRIQNGLLVTVSIAALTPVMALGQSVAPATISGPTSTATITSFPAPPPSKYAGLQDVLITARHRTERAQSVPISLTTIDKSQIQNLGSLNLNQIKQLVPTLTINAYNPRNIGLDIRGLGSVGFLGYDGLEGGVGIYLDGVLLGRSTESNFDLPDIDQIEVLRGPQGTLFGKNTVAGAVNITTRLPSFKPEADILASYGNYNYWQLQGYATSAIGNSDKVAASISFHATQHDGYIKNTGNSTNPNAGNRYNNQDDKGVRVQTLLQPNSNLTVRIIANYDHSDANCCITTPTGVVTHFADGLPYGPTTASPTGTHPYISILPGAEGSTNGLGRLGDAGYTLPKINPYGRTTDIDSWNHYAMETAGLSIQADYNLDGFTLTSITAGSYYNWYPHLDGDAIGANLLTAANNTTHQRQFSQELRVTSPLGGALDYTTGLYFFYQQLNDQAISRYGTQAAADIAGSNTSAAYLNDKAALTGFDTAATDIPETYSGAVYGQATWHITSKLDLTGGARLTYEDKTGIYYVVEQGGENLATLPNAQAVRNTFTTGVATANTLGYHLQHSDILPGGLVTLTYKPQPNILTYATYSHGEKSAGLNLVFQNVPKVVAPEKIDNYEIGAKTTLLNDHLLLNGDGFWDEDTNFQSTILGAAGPAGTLTAYLANVPKVRSRGLEVDAHALIGENLNLFVSGVFDEAVYESDPSGQCPIELSDTHTTCNLSGKPLAGASKWAASFGGEYDQPLPPIYGRETLAYFGGNYLVRTGFYSTGDDSKYSFVPSYGVGNITFGLRQANGKWDLSGWIHNFTNAHYYIFRSVNGSLPDYNLVTGEVGDPLTFGVTLRAKFE